MSNRYDVPPATFEMELSEGLYLADVTTRSGISAFETALLLQEISNLDNTRAWGTVYQHWIANNGTMSDNHALLSTFSGPVFIDILIPSAGANWVQGTVAVLGSDGTNLSDNFANFVNDFNTFYFQGSAGVTYIFFMNAQHIGTGSGTLMEYRFVRE